MASAACRQTLQRKHNVLAKLEKETVLGSF